MSETKYTPGPWIREGRTVYALSEIPGRYRKGQPVETNRMSVHVDGTRGLTTDDEYTANACLIAAAPELLEALKSMAGWAGGMDADKLPAPWSEMVMAANAAIAKAEGRS